MIWILLGALVVATVLATLARAIFELDPETLAVPEEDEPGHEQPIAELATRFRSSAAQLRFAGGLVFAAVAYVLGLRGTGLPIPVDVAGTVLLGGVLGFIVPDFVVFGRQMAIVGRAARLILWIDTAMRPLVRAMERIATFFVQLPVDGEDVTAQRENAPATPSGVLDRVLTLASADVAEVMTNRNEIVALRTGATVAQVGRLLDSTRHGQFLICEREIDQVVGVIGISDLLAAPDPSTPIDGFVRKVARVSERTSALDLLIEMDGSGETFAVVIDEFGAVSGIVTHADLAAEIVGRIAEEGDPRAFEFEQLDRHVWDLSGALKIERVNEVTGLGIPDGEYQTLAGFILHRIGRVPRPHEKVDWGDARFEILAANRRRIVAVRLRTGRRQRNGRRSRR